MLKEGRWRAVRNLPIGWIAHANHGRDFSDKMSHYCAEVFVLLLLSVPAYCMENKRLLAYYLPSLFVVVHTAWWVVNGNFHVCLLDSIKIVKNAGWYSVIQYIGWVDGLMQKTGAVKAILVYGSFCRGRFHERSDLDLRILRKEGIVSVLKLFPVVVYARWISMLRGIPTDLQFVDSEAFLLKQMRVDEHPVCVFGKENLKQIEGGLSFKEAREHPEKVLRKIVLQEPIG